MVRTDMTERDPALAPAVAITMESDEPGPRAHHLEKLIEPVPGKALMEVAHDDGFWIGGHELEGREILAKRCRGGQM